LVANYCNKLELNTFVKKTATDIADEVCKNEIIVGRNPSSVATASILLALKLCKVENIGRKELAEVSKITENTITSALGALYEYRNIICPSYIKSNLDSIKM